MKPILSILFATTLAYAALLALATGDEYPFTPPATTVATPTGPAREADAQGKRLTRGHHFPRAGLSPAKMRSTGECVFACGDYPDSAEGVGQNKTIAVNMVYRRTHIFPPSHPATRTAIEKATKR